MLISFSDLYVFYYLDNEGYVIKHPKQDMVVTYEVEATHKGEIRRYQYKTKIKKLSDRS